jgi:hypothetical protein
VPIMIEVEDRFQPFATAVREALDRLRETVARASAAGSVDYREIEEEMGAAAAAIERSEHEVVLQALDIDAPEVLVEGQRYRRVLRTAGTYYTMAGEVTVERTLYRKRGDDKGKTVDAISLRAGVVGQGWLPRTAQAMAFECQRGPSREAAKASGQWMRLPYSRCAFEDVAHLVGEQYGGKRLSVERGLIEGYEPPKEAASVSVSLDRVSVPMEEPRQRPVGRPRKKAPKRPITRVYRMAYAGAVTVHDEQGKALHTIRYGRMPQGDVDGLCMGLADDVAVLLAKRGDLSVSLLCDGAPEMWNLLDEHINEEEMGRPVARLVDFWHLEEKLGKAARVLGRDDEEREALVRRWRLDLLNHSRAADRILGALRASGRERARVGEERPVHDAITYLDNHRGQFDYARARREGRPIGSGAVEATCKSLFEVRLKRSGCRWKEATGAHIVDLRALALGDRWDAAIKLAMEPLRAEFLRSTAGTRQRAAA